MGARNAELAALRPGANRDHSDPNPSLAGCSSANPARHALPVAGAMTLVIAQLPTATDDRGSQVGTMARLDLVLELVSPPGNPVSFNPISGRWKLDGVVHAVELAGL